jgi:class 3 adenylate cyclase
LRCTVTVDARYRELAGSDHIPWMNPTGAEEIAVEIQDFLYGTREEPEPDRILATVLFTDIADSTATMARIGDIRWRQLLELHHEDRAARARTVRGRDVDSAGDGFLATFDGPARAIRCGLAVADVVEDLGFRFAPASTRARSSSSERG